jgi:tetratricopeptide (TPR) repeat protein
MRAHASLRLALLIAPDRPQEAYALLKSIVEPDDEGTDVQAEALYTAGHLADAIGSSDADDLLERAVAAGDAHFAPLAAHLLALRNLRIDNLEAAARNFEHALASDDVEIVASTRYNLAYMWRQRGRREDAFAALHEVAAQQVAVRHRAALTLGSMYAEDGGLAEAAEWLRLASKAEDSTIAAKSELGLGDIAAAVSDKDGARTFYTRAAARNVPGPSTIAAQRLTAIE